MPHPSQGNKTNVRANRPAHTPRRPAIGSAHASGADARNAIANTTVRASSSSADAVEPDAATTSCPTLISHSRARVAPVYQLTAPRDHSASGSPAPPRNATEGGRTGQPGPGGAVVLARGVTHQHHPRSGSSPRPQRRVPCATSPAEVVSRRRVAQNPRRWARPRRGDAEMSTRQTRLVSRRNAQAVPATNSASQIAALTNHSTSRPSPVSGARAICPMPYTGVNFAMTCMKSGMLLIG